VQFAVRSLGNVQHRFDIPFGQHRNSVRETSGKMFKVIVCNYASPKQ